MPAPSLPPSSPVLCPPRSPSGPRTARPPAPALPGSDGGGKSASPQRRHRHPSRPGEGKGGDGTPPQPAASARSTAPGGGAAPRAGGSTRAATSRPGAPRPRGQPAFPYPLTEARTSAAECYLPPTPPRVSPAFPGHRRPQGNKETQPGPAPRRRCLPAAGPPAASAPAAAGSAAALPLPGTWRRGGAAAGRPPAVPERGGWSPRSGAKGGSGEGRGSGSCARGLADGVCPPPACRSRLPRRWLPAAALAHGQRCSGGRERERDGEGRRGGEAEDG